MFIAGTFLVVLGFSYPLLQSLPFIFFGLVNDLSVVSKKKDESYSDKTVNINSGFKINKASLGKACEFFPGTEKVNKNSCINAVILAGYIGEGMDKKFDELLGGTSKLPDTVCFASHGGVTKSAENIANKIRELNFNTCMADYLDFDNGAETKIPPVCNSACPFMLLAGKSRIALGSTFSINVHHTGRWFNLPFSYKVGLNTPLLRMLYSPPLKAIVEASGPEDKEKHMALYERSLLHDFDDIPLDRIDPDDYEAYNIFTELRQN